LVSASGFSNATCTYAGGECPCHLTKAQTLSTTASYAVAGTNIVYTDGSAPVGYCVSGETLTKYGSLAGILGLTGYATFQRAQ
jgi:hypothetical protein